MARAMDIVGALTDTLKDFKREAHFSEQWKDIQGLVAHCKISTKTLIKTWSNVICRFLDSIIMISVGQRYSDHQPNTTSTEVSFFQVLDHLTVEKRPLFKKKKNHF